ITVQRNGITMLWT
nr:immunoglobulin heavy chain junction region [Mus musculus]